MHRLARSRLHCCRCGQALFTWWPRSQTVLADADREQDSHRWSSYTPHGQEIWQILSQWMGDLRQELSLQWQPTSMRLTEFSPPRTEAPPSPDPSPAGPSFGPPQWARAARAGSLGGHDFLPQADGARSTKLVLDLDSPVERARLPIFAPLFPLDHAFCHTRSMMPCSFLCFSLSSRRTDDRSKEHTSHLSACLLVSRCASRGYFKVSNIADSTPIDT